MIINLTPHPIVLDHDGTETIVPPSGTVARVTATPGSLSSVAGIPVPVAEPTTYGAVEGLPRCDGCPRRLGGHLRTEEDCLGECGGLSRWIVSAMVGAALRAAGDERVHRCLCPGTGPQDGAVRDAQGRIVAVTRLVRP